MKRLLALVLVLVCVLGLVGCANKEPVENVEDTDIAVLEDATEWFKQQTTRYEIIHGEVCNNAAIFLTGTKNPDTDSYQLLQTFVVNKNDNGYVVTAMKDCDRSFSAGISAQVLVSDGLTVVFGDTGDSVYNLENGNSIDVEFTKVNIFIESGETKSKEINGNAPYLLVFAGELEVSDIEFLSSELSVKYSDYYDKNLMDDTASYDVTNVFD